MNSLKRLSDKELIGRLRQLVRKEQDLTLSILPHLAEVEGRKLYLEKAYSTLSEYCICELGYGESSAWRRVRAARVIQEIPEVYNLIKQDRLSFSAVLQIANVLTPANKNELLPRVERKSKSEIDNIIAEFQPFLTIPDRARPRLVKKAIQRAPAGTLSSRAGKRAGGPELGENSLHSEGKYDPSVKKSTPEIEVVLEKMFEIQFAAEEELMELIKWLKSHLSHKFPRGGPSTVNNLRLLCAKHNKYTAEQVYGERCIKKHYIKEAPVAYRISTGLIIKRFDMSPCGSFHTYVGANYLL
jgi:hypothetical protein